MFTAVPDCTEIGIAKRVVRHTCTPLFTVVETRLSSRLSSGEAASEAFKETLTTKSWDKDIRHLALIAASS